MDYRKNRFWVIAGILCVMFVSGLASCDQGVDPIPTPAPVPVITINAQPKETTTVTQGSISGTLSVGATVTESAALRYQWYSHTEKSNTGGKAVSNAKSASFTIPTGLRAGTYYYYCEVTAKGAETKRSAVSTVKVNEQDTPPVPVITINTHPVENTTVKQGEISGSLSVGATVTENAALSYQWYENTSASNSGGEVITDATSAAFNIPTTLTEGTYYYYCEVMAEGAETKHSAAATVKVNEQGTPPVPVIKINTHPVENTTVKQGNISVRLSVEATVTPDTALGYQWYQNTVDSISGALPVSGGVYAIFSIPTELSEGTYYFYCEVTATGAETKRSNMATVEVDAEGTVYSPIELPFEVWKDGNILTHNDSQHFTFKAIADSHYIHVRFGTLDDLYIQVRDSRNTLVGTRKHLYGSTTYTTQSLNKGETYYISVLPDYNHSGDYSILYNVYYEPFVPVITINTQPEETTTVTQGEISGALSVGATVTGNAELSYQWYQNTSASNTGGTKIDNATEMSFTIPTTLTEETYYYYCEVTAEGADTKYSDTATVEVNAPVPVISITTQPAPTTIVTEGDISDGLTLSVVASVTPGAALSYQWYLNTSANNSGGEVITGATNASYTIRTDLTEGTYYYYCEVTAEGADTKRSTVATVKVDPSYNGDISIIIFNKNSRNTEASP